jgi:hypothetical protein
MARKATAGQKATAKKYGVRVTKTIRGKRVEKSAEQLKKEIASAKARLAKKNVAAKKRAASTRQTAVKSPSKSDDRRIKGASKAGKRKSKKTAVLTYRVKDPKTGKMVTKKVRRRNANQTGKVSGGRTYTERRVNRTDKGKFL